jgi:hypothetical protein
MPERKNCLYAYRLTAKHLWLIVLYQLPTARKTEEPSAGEMKRGRY